MGFDAGFDIDSDRLFIAYSDVVNGTNTGFGVLYQLPEKQYALAIYEAVYDVVPLSVGASYSPAYRRMALAIADTVKGNRANYLVSYSDWELGLAPSLIKALNVTIGAIYRFSFPQSQQSAQGIGSTAVIVGNLSTPIQNQRSQPIDSVQGSVAIQSLGSPTQSQKATAISSQATAVGGMSWAVQTQASQALIYTTVDADAQDFFTRNQQNSGSPVSANAQSAINAFVVGCKSDGIWNSLLEVGVFVGNNLAGALTKLKYPPGGASSYGNSNFTDVDYSENTGLLGNGTNKYLSSDVAPSNLNSANGYFAAYVNQRVTTNGYAVLIGAGYLGSDYSVTSRILVSDSSIGVRVIQYNDTSGGALSDDGVGNYLAVGALTGENDFKNLEKSGSSGTPKSFNGDYANYKYAIFAQRLAASVAFYASARLCFVAIGNSTLTDAQAVALYNRIQSLQVALLRPAPVMGSTATAASNHSSGTLASAAVASGTANTTQEAQLASAIAHTAVASGAMRNAAHNQLATVIAHTSVANSPTGNASSSQSAVALAHTAVAIGATGNAAQGQSAQALTHTASTSGSASTPTQSQNALALAHTASLSGAIINASGSQLATAIGSIQAYDPSVVTDTDAQDFFNRLYRNAGTPADATAQSAVQTFVAGAKSDGFWNAILDCCVFVGPNLAGALTKLKYVGTYTASTNTYSLPLINNNFVAANYSQATGLNPGSSNTTKYLSTGFNPAVHLSSDTSAHLSFYSRTQVVGTAYLDIGAYNSSATGSSPAEWDFTISYSDGNAYLSLTTDSSGSVGQISVANSVTTGLFLGNRSASNSFSLSRNGTNLVSGTSAGTTRLNAVVTVFWDFGTTFIISNLFFLLAGYNSWYAPNPTL